MAQNRYQEMTHVSHGYRFTYNGCGFIEIYLIEGGGRRDVLNIPDWINLNLVDREAFILLSTLWLQRNDVVRI